MAIAWSFVGTLSTYVGGNGLFLHEDGRIVSAAAPGAGTLSSILVRRGDQVEEGQVVAELVSAEISVQIASVANLIEERRAELARQQSATRMVRSTGA